MQKAHRPEVNIQTRYSMPSHPENPLMSPPSPPQERGASKSAHSRGKHGPCPSPRLPVRCWNILRQW